MKTNLALVFAILTGTAFLVTPASAQTFSDADWVSLGGVTGIGNPYEYQVNALAVDSAGNLYVGGVFTLAGGVGVNNIAKWNGSYWSALGSGINGPVNALAVSGTNLYAGGSFTTAGGVSARNIAQWNGSSWSAVGAGISGVKSLFGGVASVNALAVSGANLYVGGYFTNAGGVLASNIAVWNGSSWSALGSGMEGHVYALAVASGTLYAGGHFVTPDVFTPNNVARWDGSTWSSLGSGTDERVMALAISGTKLYAAGWFSTAGGVPADRVAQWNGNSWSAVGSGNGGWINALAVSGSKLYVGNTTVEQWDGSSWSILGSGISKPFTGVLAMAVSGGNLFVGGGFGGAGTNVVSTNIVEAIVGP